MAFLDNSGDIILDAVLTDTGRLRLAQGDGSFKISKFALGDDEINYGLYNKTHASGSAYYDLEILQTPVLEAFTNNTSNLNTKLMSMSRTNILYMPTLKLNKISSTLTDDNLQVRASSMFQGAAGQVATWADTKFVVAVDQDTWSALVKNEEGITASTNKPNGADVIQGFGGATTSPTGAEIRIDQGMDTEAISPTVGMDTDLVETAYIVEMDYRLGRIKPPRSQSPAPVNFIDDDNVASYYITDTAYVINNPSVDIKGVDDKHPKGPQAFAGPRGTIFQFRIHASAELQNSTYLFTQLGSSEDTDGAGNIFGFLVADDRDVVEGKTTYYLDTTVRVIGANTGIRMDIPVRYVKIA
jgi:hypothetical protein